MAENEVETVRVTDKKNPQRGMLVMNKSDYEGQKDQYEMYQDPGGVTMNNPPVGVDPLGRNTSGTYSKPTPSDIRYPDKDLTEFENNHGAFVQKDAASMRDSLGLPPLPGGLLVPVDDLIENRPDNPDVVPEGAALKAKGKDGKEHVLVDSMDQNAWREFDAIKHDREKVGQWVSQQRAMAKARKPLPSTEDVAKAEAGGAKPPAKAATPAARPAGSPAPAAPGGPPRPPQ